MTDFATLVSTLRTVHAPKGKEDVILLRPGGSGFLEVSSADITACINQIERMPILAAIGHDPSPLETLAIRLLIEGHV